MRQPTWSVILLASLLTTGSLRAQVITKRELHAITKEVIADTRATAGKTVVVDAQSFQRAALAAGIQAFDTAEIRQLFSSSIRLGTWGELYNPAARTWLTTDDVLFVRLRSLEVKNGEVTVMIAFVRRINAILPVEQEAYRYTFVRRGHSWKMKPVYMKEVG